MNIYQELLDKGICPETDIQWAKLRIDSLPITETVSPLILRECYTPEELESFLNQIEQINYDEGYGFQYLFGCIMLKDGTWLTRSEYDGAEGWTHTGKPSFDLYNYENAEDDLTLERY